MRTARPASPRWTETDLVTPSDVERKVAAVARSGAASRTLALSNVTGVGIDEFRRLLAPGRTYCLLGSSGVGKTTLINHLIGRDAFETKAVSGTARGLTPLRAASLSCSAGAPCSSTRPG